MQPGRRLGVREMPTCEQQLANIMPELCRCMAPMTPGLRVLTQRAATVLTMTSGFWGRYDGISPKAS